MNIARLALGTIVGGLALATTAAPAHCGSLGNWFPTTSQDGPAVKTSSKKSISKTTLAKSAKSSSKSTSGSKSADMVGAITAAPKKLYSGTKTLITGKKSTVSKSRGTVRHNVSQQNAAKPTGIKSWFTPAEPAQPRTVTEWMAQKRLDP